MSTHQPISDEATDELVRFWHRNLGKRVVALSNKPFENGQTIVTVTGVGIDPITGRHVYTIGHVGTVVVECRSCELYVEDPNRWTWHHRGLLKAGVYPEHVQAEIKRHLVDLYALDETVENRDEAIVSFKQLLVEVGQIIHVEESNHGKRSCC